MYLVGKGSRGKTFFTLGPLEMLLGAEYMVKFQASGGAFSLSQLEKANAYLCSFNEFTQSDIGEKKITYSALKELLDGSVVAYSLPANAGSRDINRFFARDNLACFFTMPNKLQPPRSIGPEEYHSEREQMVPHFPYFLHN